MADHEARRTLVKSTPELWVECSDAGSLARHLGAFGEIRVTRLEPETTVAWEGDAASGTVSLEPAGWGTRVILTAVTPGSGHRHPDSVSPPGPRRRWRSPPPSARPLSRRPAPTRRDRPSPTTLGRGPGPSSGC